MSDRDFAAEARAIEQAEDDAFHTGSGMAVKSACQSGYVVQLVRLHDGGGVRALGGPADGLSDWEDDLILRQPGEAASWMKGFCGDGVPFNIGSATGGAE